MASSNVPRILWGVCSALLVAAAAVTAIFAEPGPDPLRPPSANELGNRPLSMGEGALAKGVMKPFGDQLTAGTRITPLKMGATWSATGRMGDAKADDQYVEIDPRYRKAAHSSPDCMRIAYRAGPTGWAGLYWLSEAGNWGKVPGQDLSRFTKVTFWAKGDVGGERVEFKAGGIDATERAEYRFTDSFSASLGAVALTDQWQPYRIALDGESLSSVVGGFAWVATLADNPQGAVFYLDDIQYE